MLVTSIAACLYIPSAISVQIGFGGVGVVPGCPSVCARSCCKSSAGMVSPERSPGEGVDKGGFGKKKAKGKAEPFSADLSA